MSTPAPAPLLTVTVDDEGKVRAYPGEGFELEHMAMMGEAMAALKNGVSAGQTTTV